ncbi:uncharacterized protein YbbK (DUF523 family) [Clostridium acetobutylicum]|uniref:Uncharacterized protein, YBBK B.subtilis ortholog n=1 Tax=Clostridium acetobutylicum (strain ATCC 824 / DSM 792 / JCM 1419 / IAM 19013 / LMG 5710 / NBRC 13948 / NRRL B-527 / VKM B-1787 / 2291 / W) TaxID=272562 RepID=Q97GM7_CLOAB|nr:MULTISPECIES: DUF523 domain-containing protein [Clostridium]AAK80295.1 Uncharacterized protein, YBBK B.subtilis ortholog [Clostridium acetobutylicum ATCC 824]ADZ21390.1 Conserved hypothetical protein [Clostridium acetobutylicum EA 2018]AEI34594.1 hypothetical protein SMB_G2373 [Clostridium acetobutylicum DSM 1731]AWV79283.1 DUF523 domain-containing protein [Clostridium acetobutylicum]MBC2394747.1 DUF523 domain-containing protein [Clostridium acetobutylicum]
MKEDTIIVSACLLGVNCKYSGLNNFSKKVKELCGDKKVIPVCPEQLGGMTTPRNPAEIVNGTGKDVLEKRARVIDKEGNDVTKYFLLGAEETLKLAKIFNCSKAILKAKSPSCGLGKIYDGNFKENIIDGNGVTAEILRQNGIEVMTELD